MSQIALRALSALLVFIAASCGSTSSVRSPLRLDTVIGEYRYHCADKGAPHELDRLTLHADGKYVLVHMHEAEVASTTSGTWRLVGEPTPNIQLDNAGYPVRIQGKNVRLLINDDLGQWYEKTK